MASTGLFIRKRQKLLFWAVTVIVFLLAIFSVWPATARPTDDHPVINEIMTSNGTGLTDEEGHPSDWIELYNPANRPVNLSGYALSDDPAQPQKWRFPNITLPPHQYLIIFASGKNRQNPGRPLHTNFKLSKSGDFLGLYRLLEQQFVDTLAPAYPEQFRDMAYGRTGSGLAYLANPTPGQANDAGQVWRKRVEPVVFSVERGFYTEPVEVEMVSATAGAVIRYTTDGSAPGESSGQVYEGPVKVESSTVLRAAAFRAGDLPSKVETHTYLYLDEVVNQPPDPPGFPNTWGRHREEFKQYRPGDPVTADYEMDPDVVRDPRYQDTLKNDLRSIPIVSLVMSREDFTTLYSHPRDRGVEWERPASVELIYPDGSRPEVQVNAGVRMHGGVGRKEFIPKHSFRLLFKSQYGPTKLRYPVFPNSPVEEFNTLVLRGGSDRSFAGTGPIREKTTYTRDEWLRASQIEMSGVGSHGIFVHLYVNGLYWGLYNMVERPDEAFMASYFGGQETDWFVANQDGPLSRERSPWRDKLNELFVSIGYQGRQGDTLDSAQDYAARLYSQVSPYIDTAQFSDYIILNWYAGTEDWPQNNWYAGIPNSGGQGKYLVWDGQEIFANGAEITLGKVSSARLNIVKPLFEIFIQNPDFKMEFADRAYLHLFNNGALTDANAQARWQQINNRIDRAIVGESARWGDVWFDEPITRDDWLKARNEVLGQMDGNAQKLIWLLREAGYYPPIDPPRFSQRGGAVEPGFALQLSLPPQHSGTIYYTLNGADPRAAGSGAVSPAAVAYRGPITLTANTQVKTRLLAPDGVTWSALNQATFTVMPQGQKLRITEIMYNPVGGDDYEFIELKNNGDTPVDVSNMWFEGIDFTFPAADKPLPAGQFIVLVNNASAFAQRYPDVNIGGVYNRRLSNAGERIIIKDSGGNVVTSVAYDDELDWPVSPDGRGDSLVRVDINGDPNDAKSWRASAALHGSPGADDPQSQQVEQFVP